MLSPRTKPHDSVVTIRDSFEKSFRGGHCRGKVGNLSRFISLAVLHIVERKKTQKTRQNIDLINGKQAIA